MPTTAQDPNTNPTANGLSQFRQFIYDNYDKTHGVFSDETESAWERRFQLIKTLVISITCHVKMANNPISGQYIGV
jgi:hypothetical protein